MVLNHAFLQIIWSIKCILQILILSIKLCFHLSSFIDFKSAVNHKWIIAPPKFNIPMHIEMESAIPRKFWGDLTKGIKFCPEISIKMGPNWGAKPNLNIFLHFWPIPQNWNRELKRVVLSAMKPKKKWAIKGVTDI